MSRLSDEKLCELCAYKKDCITPRETCLDFEALKRVCDTQLEALKDKEMKLISDEEMLEYCHARNGNPNTRCSLDERCKPCNRQAQLASDLLVQDKKRAELAKEIFNYFETDDTLAYWADKLSQYNKPDDCIKWKEFKAKYVQEKGQTK
ncbi:MAG: hypothetical protein WC455_24605 [Dehalococcoidia bacterium]|jgi:hypothetical protein